MNLRILLVTGPAWVGLKDRAVVIQREESILGRIPLEDIAMLVLDGPDITITHAVLAGATAHRIGVVIADEKHHPAGVLLPISGHTTHTAILRGQIEASKPSLKRAWQAIVKAKVLAQAQLLAARQLPDGAVRKLIPFVRSGDPDNIEGQAASKYFEAAFGPTFKREREADGVNGLLNYGYAVVRAAVARAIVGAGLHPALGIHHRNQYNAFCLADDAMEPLRPLVDAEVLRLSDEYIEEDLAVTPKTKRRLIGVLSEKVYWQEQSSPLLVALERYGAQLRRSIIDGEELHCPMPIC